MRYDEFYQKKENPLEKFENIKKVFNKFWNENIDNDDSRLRIKTSKLKNFLESFENNYIAENLPKEELTVLSTNLFIFELNLLVDENNFLYFRDVFYKILRNQYGNIFHKPDILKMKENQVMEKIGADIKYCNKRYNSKKNVKIRRYNHVLPYLYFQTSLVFLKAISRIILLFNL